ncbi:hypothetical protein [Ferrimonas marina]|uniref:Uncharacterized protein n=1 Tax=Ferrimonas marina TaxID=299255 RepID=A0A1M5UKQ0_9GAMM|nr:hypothetical protein [Ferrimonas marina]SHH63575.1 hypothetical protein SAMN02745129_2616 [Ferrimonas marina]
MPKKTTIRLLSGLELELLLLNEGDDYPLLAIYHDGLSSQWALDAKMNITSSASALPLSGKPCTEFQIQSIRPRSLNGQSWALHSGSGRVLQAFFDEIGVTQQECEVEDNRPAERPIMEVKLVEGPTLALSLCGEDNATPSLVIRHGDMISEWGLDCGIDTSHVYAIEGGVSHGRLQIYGKNGQDYQQWFVKTEEVDRIAMFLKQQRFPLPNWTPLDPTLLEQQ